MKKYSAPLILGIASIIGVIGTRPDHSALVPSPLHRLDNLFQACDILGFDYSLPALPEKDWLLPQQLGPTEMPLRSGSSSCVSFYSKAPKLHNGTAIHFFSLSQRYEFLRLILAAAPI